MTSLKICDFMDSIRKPVEHIRIFTSDGMSLYVCADDDSSFARIIFDKVTNCDVDTFEINYSSVTKTLLLYTTMSQKDLDRMFFHPEEKSTPIVYYTRGTTPNLEGWT